MAETSFPKDAALIGHIAQAASHATERLREFVPPTPLVASPALSTRFGCELSFKCDHLLPSGSFKFRGAVNKLLELRDSGLCSAVVTASTGNHGAALSAVGRALGMAVTVHAPVSASTAKLAAIEAEGASVVLHNADPLGVELYARIEAERAEQCYVSPYNDVDVIAGQGSLAVEIIQQEPAVEAIFVSVGGGGMLCGVGAVLEERGPHVELVGVWPRHAPALFESMKAGRAVDVRERSTLADATAGGIEPGAITVDLATRIAPTCVLVSEPRIAAAMRMIAEHEHCIVEGAAGVALAGLEKVARRFRGRKVAVVICGRNIGFEHFVSATSR